MTEEKHPSKDGTLYFDSTRCIHSRGCVLRRPDVFVPNVDGEWIHPEFADDGELQALAENCPSGAIRYESNKKSSRAPLVNTLHVRENGPYALYADIEYGGKNEQRMTLCRCGESGNKPFCDGSHAKAAFAATGEPDLVESSPLESRNGKVDLQPTPNGPLHLSGNLEICAGTGHTVNRISNTFLCRCGHSSNKPYCDGTHAKIGFTSE